MHLPLRGPVLRPYFMNANLRYLPRRACVRTPPDVVEFRRCVSIRPFLLRLTTFAFWNDHIFEEGTKTRIGRSAYEQEWSRFCNSQQASRMQKPCIREEYLASDVGNTFAIPRNVIICSAYKSRRRAAKGCLQALS